jgi:hypothetical protein
MLPTPVIWTLGEGLVLTMTARGSMQGRSRRLNMDHAGIQSVSNFLFREQEGEEARLFSISFGPSPKPWVLTIAAEVVYITPILPVQHGSGRQWASNLGARGIRSSDVPHVIWTIGAGLGACNHCPRQYITPI